MYNIGDAVFHPTSGAGIITKLERMPEIKKGSRFYRIRMLQKNNTVLRIPVSRAEELGLRPALAQEEVGQILDILSAQAEELPQAHSATRSARRAWTPVIPGSSRHSSAIYAGGRSWPAS